MTAQPEITQPDPRKRSKEILDAVQAGQSFTVTRDGHQIDELVPRRSSRRFVSRQDFTAMSHSAPIVSLEAFHADQCATADQYLDDPDDR
ncbi:prevent-host-death protein [Kitasatospora acidiphila]|uniref:Prevent-host-death protein n=1 Tax=Kitasatospora acidiphila TaxID=2567942 RepID=A0A540WFR3_9ACTN|nr:prevent-host-death protein [Kitasatospora acidiphila]TQF07264.1 prevent-host-death protein [Kitasatospora acidiphila]